jgi:hypothetical protein
MVLRWLVVMEMLVRYWNGPRVWRWHHRLRALRGHRVCKHVVSRVRP